MTPPSPLATFVNRGNLAIQASGPTCKAQLGLVLKILNTEELNSFINCFEFHLMSITFLIQARDDLLEGLAGKATRYLNSLNVRITVGPGWLIYGGSDS